MRSTFRSHPRSGSLLGCRAITSVSSHTSKTGSRRNVRTSRLPRGADTRRLSAAISSRDSARFSYPNFDGSMLKEWAAARSMSPKTLGNVLSPLRIALDDAVSDELIDQNPLAGWKIKRRRNAPGAGKAKIHSRLTRFPRGTRSNSQDAGRPGLQPDPVCILDWAQDSELCALDWADVDWLRGLVRVSRALTQGSEEAEEPGRPRPDFET